MYASVEGPSWSILRHRLSMVKRCFLHVVYHMVLIAYIFLFSTEKGHGESCSSSMECLVTDSICDRGLCGCSSTMYLQGMTCLNSKFTTLR